MNEAEMSVVKKGAEMSPYSSIGQDVNPLRDARLQTVHGGRGEYIVWNRLIKRSGRPSKTASKTCNLDLAQRFSCHLMLIPRKPCEVCAN